MTAVGACLIAVLFAIGFAVVGAYLDAKHGDGRW